MFLFSCFEYHVLRFISFVTYLLTLPRIRPMSPPSDKMRNYELSWDGLRMGFTLVVLINIRQFRKLYEVMSS
jgi:hypothetical protein